MIPLLIAALTALAGSAVNQVNQNRVLHKQNNVVEQGIEEARRKQREASGLLDQQVNQIAHHDPRADEAASLAQYVSALNAAKPAAGGSSHLSSAYDALAGGSDADVNAYGSGLADTLSHIDAPLQQRRDERSHVQDLGIGIDRIRDQLQADQYIRQLKLNNIRPNGFLQLISSGLGGASREFTAQGSGGGGSGSGGVPVDLYGGSGANFGFSS